MWLCAGACNEQMVIATLKAIDCDPRQWMAALLTSTNSKVFGQPARLAAHLNGDSVAGIPLMIALKNYHRRSPQEVEALMAYSDFRLSMQYAPFCLAPIYFLSMMMMVGKNIGFLFA